MGRLNVEVTFQISDVYGIPCKDADDAMEREEELIEEAKQQLLDDLGLQSWQGEWATSYVNHDETGE